MAIDLDKIREMHEKLSSPGTGGSSDFTNNFVQLQEGTTVLRILPPKEEDQDFYAMTKIHRGSNVPFVIFTTRSGKSLLKMKLSPVRLKGVIVIT